MTMTHSTFPIIPPTNTSSTITRHSTESLYSHPPSLFCQHIKFSVAQYIDKLLHSYSLSSS